MTQDSQTQGWVQIDNLVTIEECEFILAECNQIISNPDDRHHRDKPASGTKHLEELDQRIDLVADVVTRSELTTAVQEWFGLDHAPGPHKVSLRSPRPGYGGQDLHRDTLEGPPQAQPQAVTAIISLVAFNDANGATRIVPGSHMTGQPASQFQGRRSAPGEVRFVGKAGTAFVFNAHCLHAGGENQSNAERPALQIAWHL